MSNNDFTNRPTSDPAFTAAVQRAKQAGEKARQQSLTDKQTEIEVSVERHQKILQQMITHIRSEITPNILELISDGQTHFTVREIPCEYLLQAYDDEIRKIRYEYSCSNEYLKAKELVKKSGINRTNYAALLNEAGRGIFEGYLYAGLEVTFKINGHYGSDERYGGIHITDYFDIEVRVP